jgi:DNA polymerase III epsilon subunit-like protein
MLKVKGDKKIDEKNFYIKWATDLKISAEAARITRYNQKTIDTLGITPEECFPTIKDWLENADYIVGHNVLGFDIYLIKEFYKYMGQDSSHLYDKFLDTSALAKGIKMSIPFKSGDSLLEYQYRNYHKKQKGIKTNLLTLGKEYNIQHDYDNLHDAIIDLELNLKVWNKLKYMIEI